MLFVVFVCLLLFLLLLLFFCCCCLFFFVVVFFLLFFWLKLPLIPNTGNVLVRLRGCIGSPEPSPLRQVTFSHGLAYCNPSVLPI